MDTAEKGQIAGAILKRKPRSEAAKVTRFWFWCGNIVLPLILYLQYFYAMFELR